MEQAPEASSGWLAALKDEHIRHAMRAIHYHPEKMDGDFIGRGLWDVTLWVFSKVYRNRRQQRKSLFDRMENEAQIINLELTTSQI
ncbi:hypothetical protein [Sessilibacter corallicola]|uniref:Uncharacterized protein n=1 Tax=Sessilibacter corallicola TaxID=2904075 RepID=A0ABQ0A6F1_9GAMM